MVRVMSPTDWSNIVDGKEDMSPVQEAKLLNKMESYESIYSRGSREWCTEFLDSIGLCSCSLCRYYLTKYVEG